MRNVLFLEPPPSSRRYPYHHHTTKSCKNVPGNHVMSKMFSTDSNTSVRVSYDFDEKSGKKKKLAAAKYQSGLSLALHAGAPTEVTDFSLHEGCRYNSRVSL